MGNIISKNEFKLEEAGESSQFRLDDLWHCYLLD